MSDKKKNAKISTLPRKAVSTRKASTIKGGKLKPSR
jgi:hypothetical protein